MADSRKETERAELHRTIWGIANDLRGSVDGWDFKQIEGSALGTDSEDDFKGLFDDIDVNSNKLTEENIGNILRVFTERREKIDYVSRLVDNDEIAANEYNLSVSSYVEAEDTREVIDIKLLNARIAGIVANENTLRAQIDRIIGEIEG